MNLQGRRPTTGRPQCCCHRLRWLRARTVQDNPQVRLSFVEAAIANGLAVRWLLGVRDGHDLQRHPVWVVQDLVAIDLDSGAPIQVPIIFGHGRVKQAFARYRERHQRTGQVRKRQGVAAPARGGLAPGLGASIEPPRHSCVRRPLRPTRNGAVREAFHSNGGSQVTKAEPEQHYVPHGGRIAGRHYGGRQPDSAFVVREGALRSAKAEIGWSLAAELIVMRFTCREGWGGAGCHLVGATR